MVVKNSLAARAAAGTPLAPMFEGLTGTAAVCWGGEDMVTLAKEVSRFARDTKYQPFAPVGGVMDGEKLSPEQVEQVSKWPSRQEQLSLLVGQILGPGARLAAQLLGRAARWPARSSRWPRAKRPTKKPTKKPTNRPRRRPRSPKRRPPDSAPRLGCPLARKPSANQ